jgi:hypothetical protein
LQSLVRHIGPFLQVHVVSIAWQLAAATRQCPGSHPSLQPSTWYLFENAFATRKVAFGLGARAVREGSAVAGTIEKQPSSLTRIETRSVQHAPHLTPQWGEGQHFTHPPFWQTKDRAQDGGCCPGASPTGCAVASHVVPGGVTWHRKEWWLQGRWASCHSRVGEACCLQQACP